MQGSFITLEGIEGAGKSTCMAEVRKVLKENGREVLETREPGGTLLGEDLRQLLLGHKHAGMHEDTELLLMFAARAEHLHRKILPALREGQWVLCDRFTDASYAYQGGGRGMGMKRIATLEAWVQGDIRPHLTLLMDLPVEQGLERAGKRSSPDRFESEALAFFERVRQTYLDIARRDPGRVKIIDASRPLKEVQAQVHAVIKAFLEQRQHD
jgi:dTMP kinase